MRGSLFNDLLAFSGFGKVGPVPQHPNCLARPCILQQTSDLRSSIEVIRSHFSNRSSSQSTPPPCFALGLSLRQNHPICYQYRKWIHYPGHLGTTLGCARPCVLKRDAGISGQSIVKMLEDNGDPNTNGCHLRHVSWLHPGLCQQARGNGPSRALTCGEGPSKLQGPNLRGGKRARAQGVHGREKRPKSAESGTELILKTKQQSGDRTRTAQEL